MRKFSETCNIRFLPPAAKFLKKLRDKQLFEKIRKMIDDIVKNPYIGEEKTGDLEGLLCCGFNYDGTSYRIAYTLREIHDEMVVVVMIGTRENFYDELKRYMN